VSPAKAIIMLILFSNTLFNSVWAAAHLVAEQHGAFETPHIHITGDVSHHAPQQPDNADGVYVSAHGHDAESEESHFHLMVLSAESDSTTPTNLQHVKANSQCWFSRSQTYTPPIPPPTCSA